MHGVRRTADGLPYGRFQRGRKVKEGRRWLMNLRVIPFRITDPPKDAPLFLRRTIRGGRCIAVATGRPPRRSNAEKEQVDRVYLYCELVLGQEKLVSAFSVEQ